VRTAAALVRGGDPAQAGSRAAAQALASLGDGAPSFGVVFASAHYYRHAETVLTAVTALTGDVPLIGCVGEAVIGSGQEAEGEPAVSVLIAADAGQVESYEMEFVRTATGGAFGGYLFEPGPHLMIADPYSFPVDLLLEHLNQNVPGTVIAGGMASAGSPRQRSRLFLDGKVRAEGAVGMRLAGAEVHPLVSQGCRAVGEPFTVTSAEGNIIYQLGGASPWRRLRELADELSRRDQQLLSDGVQLGIVIDEYRSEQGPGDFLIRSVLGGEPESGALAIGDDVEVGQTVQFHLRDAESADEDLRRTLRREVAALGGDQPAGAVLFSCNGRGARLFGRPDHDAELVSDALGDIPLAGFFCGGELGPIAGRNFLHTFTASIAVFHS
jgi:small ligand-binding sensory domain FIST